MSENLHSAAQRASIPKGRLWIGRIMSALPALFLVMDGVMKLMKPDFCWESNGSTRISRKCYCPSRDRRAGLRHPLRNSRHGRSRRDPLDWLSRRRRCYARTCWRSALLPRALPGLLRDIAVGRTLPARRATARTHSTAKLRRQEYGIRNTEAHRHLARKDRGAYRGWEKASHNQLGLFSPRAQYPG
jgi:hypothetical protein